MATTTLMALSFALLLDGERPGPKPGGFDRPGNGSATRSVVMARNGMVCTSQPLASQAGIALLRKGGNAFDAIVGAAAVLNVVEPMMTGIGGDMFAIAWDAKEGKLVGLNGSGRSSSRATAEAFRAKGYRTVPTHGPDSVTVPGAFHGWATLHARYGKLPLEDVLAEAVRHAEEGFPVSEVIASNWREGAEWAEVPEFRDAFLVREADPAGRPSWRAPRAGEVFRAPDLGRTLRALGKGGIGEFYKGDVARRIAEHLRSRGSSIDLDDLAKHESTWVEPMNTTFRGYTLHELPPNGQGLAALQMLNMLEQYDLEALGHNSAPYIHLLLESKKLAFADRDRWVADPSFRELPLATLVSKEYAGKMRARIDPARAGSFPRSTLDLAAETTYLCAADKDGNAVSFINSLFHGFGSGLVVPGTGHLPPEQRLALFPRGGSPEPSRALEAPAPHDHPRLRHSRRKALALLRSHGRRHAAAGARPGLPQHGRLRHEPAGGGGGAPGAGNRRRGGSRERDRPRRRRGAEGPGAPH